MTQHIDDIVGLLNLEPLEVNLFRGESRDLGTSRVFGGQVLGQALNAASRTVDNRAVHSLHAYFLRAGDVNAPIVYQVHRNRDGHSFSNRHVVAIQHGEQIFNMTASFQSNEPGLEHQVPMPRVPPPEDLPDNPRIDPRRLAQLPERVRQLLGTPRPFLFRTATSPDRLGESGRPLARQVWFRTVGQVADDPVLHRCLLAYVSDFHLLETATLPHGIAFMSGKAMMASIDHAMWFHRSARVDDWLLFDVNSPSASGARGFACANVFDRAGRLVASTAQEGLVRLVNESVHPGAPGANGG